MYNFTEHLKDEKQKAEEKPKKVMSKHLKDFSKTKQASAASSSSDQLMDVLLRLEKQQKKTNFHLTNANFYLRFCAIAAFAIVLYTTINWFLHGHWWFVPMKFTPLN
jgi:Flp pilus assembly protein TadB